MKLRPGMILAFTVAAALLVGPSAFGQHKHILVNEQDVKWVDGPPFMPPGAKIAVLEGNPAEKGMVAIRIMLPANYKIAAHWHPSDEHVVVLSGTLFLGTGDKLDMDAAKPLKAGGFGMMPAKMNHFAYTKDATTILVYGMGPVEFNYVNPADDPRKAEKK
jgi:hypothetical protein